MATAPHRQGLASQEEKLLACVHCGFCLPVCPTYRVLGDEADSPRGRLHLMRAVAEGRLPPEDPSLHRHLDRCLGCRACEPVCPSGVPYGELLEHARQEVAAVRRPGLITRLLLGVFGNRWPNRLFAVKGRVLRATGLPVLLAGRKSADGTPAALGSTHRLRVAMAMLAASAPWEGLRNRGEGPVGPDASDDVPKAPTSGMGRVGVLKGCVQQGLFARVGDATRRTLAANGYEVVEVEDVGCCGALHAHAGALDAARARARRQIEAFQEAGAEWVAVDAAGCGAAMKGYATLLEHDHHWAERAAAFSASVRDVSELLSRAGPRPGGRMELTAAYDPPCHLLHGQGVSEPVQDVLRAVPGLNVLPVPDGSRCCGGAGIYGLTQRELGDAIAGEKIQAVASTGADVVLSGNPGCMMQIGAGLLLAGVDMGVVHPVEILDESYRRAGVYGRGASEAGTGLP
jgi:glycolate oxidase iron-sulfur subunit